VSLHRSACLALVGLIAIPVLPSGVAPGGRRLVAELTGAAEAPGPGDPDGSGTAVVRVNPGLATVCWELTVTDVDNVVAAHIHVAPVGEPGPVVVPLSAPVSGSSAGCAEVDGDLAHALVQSPSDDYVNVHSAEFPGGAVRGQLAPPDDDE